MEICRLCLDYSSHLMNVANDDKLSTRIKDCVSIKITKNDGLPEYACVNCIKKVDDWYTFKEMCIASSQSLSSSKASDLKKSDEEIYDLNQEHMDDRSSLSDIDDVDDDSDFDFSDDLFLEETSVVSQGENSPEKKYTCTICSKEFDTCVEYLDHQEEHNGESVFKCFKCPEVFTTRKELVSHDRSHKVKCPLCGVFIMKNSMKLHLVKHTDRHVCPHCSNHFLSRATMNQHIITVHTNIKDHVCESCGKRFASVTGMKVHLKSHSDIREYKCKHCNYAGKTASALYVHMSKHSKDICVCEVCSKIFKSHRNLKDHLRRVHSEEKKHECYQCHKKFVDKYMLTVHLRSHTGVRPYKCTVCTKAFMRSDALKEHLATHSDRVKHGCKTCGKQFTSKRGVVRHQCIATL